MTKIIIRLVLYAAAILLIGAFVPGIHISNFTSALLVALVWGVISVTLRPILGLITLPINFITLGLFSFILNALLFWLMTILPGFTVDNFIAALQGSVMLTLAGWVFQAVFK